MRRVPAVMQWGVGVGFFLGWPHAVIGYSNKAHDVPKMNLAYL